MTAPMHLPYKTATSKLELLDRSLLARENMLKSLKENLHKARNRMKQVADKKRTDRELNVTDLVYIRLKPYWQIDVCGPKDESQVIPYIFWYVYGVGEDRDCCLQTTATN